MDLQNWKTQLRKGFLELCALNCLQNCEIYGYDLVQTLKEVDGLAMREGTIYPVLARLEEEGLVASERRPSASGPPRRWFRITPAGRRALAEMNEHWGRMVSAIDAAGRLHTGGGKP
jgi:PadR family transcriptional regulator PadR